jgi:hypothetical protein
MMILNFFPRHFQQQGVYCTEAGPRAEHDSVQEWPLVARSLISPLRRRPLSLAYRLFMGLTSNGRSGRVDVSFDFKTTSLSIRWFRTEAAFDAASKSNHGAERVT